MTPPGQSRDGTAFAIPTVKQHLASLRMLFDWLITGQVIDANPVADAWAAAAWATDAAAWAAAKATRAATRAATSSDLDRLIALNLGQPGTLGAPIDPSEAGPLGPLWPQGVPEWYTEAATGTVTPHDEPSGDTD